MVWNGAVTVCNDYKSDVVKRSKFLNKPYIIQHVNGV